MTTFMEQYRRVVDWLNVLMRWFLATLLLVMVVLISWQVFARFVVGDSLTFSEEVSRFTMVWLVVVGAAYAAKNGRLMKVDIVEHVLKGRAKTTVMMIAGIMSIAFYLMLVLFGFFIVNAVSYQSTPATEISMSIPMAAVPVGALLLIMNTLYYMFGVALGIEEETEVEELVAEAEADADRDHTRLGDVDGDAGETSVGRIEGTDTPSADMPNNHEGGDR